MKLTAKPTKCSWSRFDPMSESRARLMALVAALCVLREELI